MTALVTIRDLVVDFSTRQGRVRALDGASLTVREGEKVGLVGESGSGKSTLALALGRLLPPNAEWASGELMVAGQSVRELKGAALRRLRIDTLGYVFQDPIGTLDPTMRIANQLAAVMEAGSTGADVTGLLADVGLQDHRRIARSYPHELSGGMAQRVSIAMALAANPKLIVADEPTASLDASIRGQILDLLVALCAAHGTALVLSSHDLRAIAHCCDRVAVMYGGRTVEVGATAEVFGQPVHPYTEALLRAAPGQEGLGGRIEPIPGLPPVLTGRAEDCTFEPRCRHRIDACALTRPESSHVAERQVICHRAAEREPATR